MLLGLRTGRCNDRCTGMTRTLEGCRVLVTRERPGELAVKLAERGATVIHVPLIAVLEAADGGQSLRDALSRLAEFDWLVVTSPAGAERVGEAARRVPGVQLASVGTATAKVLQDTSGRRVGLVPAIQRAEGLAAAFIENASAPQRVLIAHADIAAPTLADALRRAGHDVTTVTAYRTVVRAPDRPEAPDADAVVFASGYAVESWCRAFGATGPPLVVAIGPTTAAAADRFGLKVSAVAADHSLDGLVSELERLHAGPGSSGEGRSRRPH
jgi:uroporphyrinogen-III synthase